MKATCVVCGSDVDVSQMSGGERAVPRLPICQCQGGPVGVCYKRINPDSEEEGG
jgi:hypothetical protein